VLHRSTRFAAWVVAVGLVGAGPAIARLDLPHRHAIAAAWTVAHLSAIVWMLALPAHGAIRLSSFTSQLLVLGGAVVMLWVATGSWGPAALLSAAMLAMNHVRVRPVRIGREPALGNPWRLAPGLWHPALWLVAQYAPGSGAAWAGVGLVPCAQATAVLIRSPSRAVRAIAWAAWCSAGVATAALLW